MRFCGGGERKLEGLVLGGGNSVGKPWDNLTLLGTLAHPAVALPVVVATHAYTTPGTEFATAVAKNVETGSNEIPQPARKTVLPAPGV